MLHRITNIFRGKKDEKKAGTSAQAAAVPNGTEQLNALVVQLLGKATRAEVLEKLEDQLPALSSEAKAELLALDGDNAAFAHKVAAAYSADNADTRMCDEVAFYTSMAPVMIFSKSYCPFCKKAKELALSKKVTPVVIELDRRADGKAMQEHLLEMTGQRTVPSVWVNGKFIGGYDHLRAAVEEGALDSAGVSSTLKLAVDQGLQKCGAEDGLPCLCGVSPSELAKQVKVPAEVKRAQKKYPNCVIGSEKLMAPKAYGTSATPVQQSLRWGADRDEADRVCNFNRHYAEHAGYFTATNFEAEATTDIKAGNAVDFYDSNTGLPLFKVGGTGGRNWKQFVRESEAHGWPSFRDGDVNWDHVRVLPNGEVVSTAGTHLGHNLPDSKGNRFCINLVSVAGMPAKPAASA